MALPWGLELGRSLTASSSNRNTILVLMPSGAPVVSTLAGILGRGRSQAPPPRPPPATRWAEAVSPLRPVPPPTCQRRGRIAKHPGLPRRGKTAPHPLCLRAGAAASSAAAVAAPGRATAVNCQAPAASLQPWTPGPGVWLDISSTLLILWITSSCPTRKVLLALCLQMSPVLGKGAGDFEQPGETALALLLFPNSDRTPRRGVGGQRDAPPFPFRIPFLRPV
ncbi:Hypothetical predicted protein [Podarcis lilfordi]|uniref:Uncharacterized protein n=1 Tax=Podarcis lilfordi TaxID=74358 RepID=A0AA35LN38_9SAUR|nr:Hypothetical predicted protein [Podarcis lilfordi]